MSQYVEDRAIVALMGKALRNEHMLDDPNMRMLAYSTAGLLGEIAFSGNYNRLDGLALANERARRRVLA